MNGVLDPNNQDQTAIRDIIDPIPAEGIDQFGIDRQSPLPIDSVDYPSVAVDDVECPLTDSALDTFEGMFDPLELCEDYGIGLYISAGTFASSH